MTSYHFVDGFIVKLGNDGKFNIVNPQRIELEKNKKLIELKKLHKSDIIQLDKLKKEYTDIIKCDSEKLFNLLKSEKRYFVYFGSNIFKYQKSTRAINNLTFYNDIYSCNVIRLPLRPVKFLYFDEPQLIKDINNNSNSTTINDMLPLVNKIDDNSFKITTPISTLDFTNLNEKSPIRDTSNTNTNTNSPQFYIPQGIPFEQQQQEHPNASSYTESNQQNVINSPQKQNLFDQQERIPLQDSQQIGNTISPHAIPFQHIQAQQQEQVQSSQVQTSEQNETITSQQVQPPHVQEQNTDQQERTTSPHIGSSQIQEKSTSPLVESFQEQQQEYEKTLEQPIPQLPYSQPLQISTQPSPPSSKSSLQQHSNFNQLLPQLPQQSKNIDSSIQPSPPLSKSPDFILPLNSPSFIFPSKTSTQSEDQSQITQNNNIHINSSQITKIKRNEESISPFVRTTGPLYQFFNTHSFTFTAQDISIFRKLIDNKEKFKKKSKELFLYTYLKCFCSLNVYEIGDTFSLSSICPKCDCNNCETCKYCTPKLHPPCKFDAKDKVWNNFEETNRHTVFYSGIILSEFFYLLSSLKKFSIFSSIFFPDFQIPEELLTIEQWNTYNIHKKIFHCIMSLITDITLKPLFMVLVRLMTIDFDKFIKNRKHSLTSSKLFSSRDLKDPKDLRKILGAIKILIQASMYSEIGDSEMNSVLKSRNICTAWGWFRHTYEHHM